MNELADGIKIQGRVLLALMLREARTRYGRRRAGYLWALLEPVMHVTFFYFIFKYMRGAEVPLGDNLFVFLATGFVPFIGWRNAFTRIQSAYGSNQALLSFPTVSMMDVFLGRAFLELATWTTSMVVIFGGIAAYGEPLPHDILKMLAAILALFMTAFGLGLCLGLLVQFVPAVSSFIYMPRRILYWLSATFFLPDNLPSVVRDVLAWNPLVHAITLLREGYYYGYESQMLDVGYLYTWGVGLVLVAFVAEKAARKPIRNVI